ncbi:MAG: hypothetical protein OXI54_14010 [Chloroflexota bacterium]|nr:hypothetical protein [Chloroflexota bacterium]MDE2685241.1 hypothetical protein [Chloroflexota bacterium]
MTTREMTALDSLPIRNAQTAHEFLAASDREFAAGDHLQGSEKLYGAATQAIIAICQQRGWRYKSHRAMQQAVAALSREYDDPFIVSGYDSAQRFHENFFHDNLEDYEIEASRPAVHQFVARLLTFLDGGQ